MQAVIFLNYLLELIEVLMQGYLDKAHISIIVYTNRAIKMLTEAPLLAIQLRNVYMYFLMKKKMLPD